MEENKTSEREAPPIPPVLDDQLKEKKTAEEKLRVVIDFMRESLSQGKTPRFKDFWNAKHHALILFKEKINPAVRTVLWQEYTELALEAKRLKEILDEESAFAVTQIEQAIEGFEKDLEKAEEFVREVPPLEFPEMGRTLLPGLKNYQAIQAELGFLNTFATRLSAMRKEVIKTEMRIRFKNKLLQRISSLGDHVFPKRKELIKKVSEAFIEDVNRFVNTHFASDEGKTPLYELREEIKAFQEVAKKLTLSTQAFQESRQKLSACWEKVREQGKDRKKEFSEKKEIFAANFKMLDEKVKALASSEGVDLQKEVDAILKEMRDVELSREGVNALKDQLFALKRGEEEKARAEAKMRADVAKEKKRARLAEIDELFASVEKRINEGDLSDIGPLLDEKNLSESERARFAPLMAQIGDRTMVETEKTLLAQTDVSEDLLNALEDALLKRRAARDRLRGHLENLRREVGGSGLDFERAIMVREEIDSEKKRLNDFNEAIIALEKRIDDITE